MGAKRKSPTPLSGTFLSLYIDAAVSPGSQERYAQAEKEEPQPQVDVAFGLRITNCEPSRPSV